MSQTFPLQESAQHYVEILGANGQGQVTPLDVSDLEWLDGLEAESLSKAMEIYEQGQSGG